MFAVTCPGCFYGLPEYFVLTPQLLVAEAHLALLDWGFKDTGGPDWNPKFIKQFKAYQQAREYPYITGEPDFWTLYDLVEPRIGDPGYAIWAEVYRSVTGKEPNAGIWQIQFGLRQLKFNPGPVDGRMGPKTQAAIKLWQKMHGFPQTGVMGPDQVAQLAAEVSEEKTLGTLLVTATPPPQPVPTPAGVEPPPPPPPPPEIVRGVEEPEVAEIIVEAKATGVPIEVKQEPAVAAAKVMVVREPVTKKILKITKLVPPPPPKEVNPWVWVGLSAAAVAVVGTVATILSRGRKKDEGRIMDKELMQATR